MIEVYSGNPGSGKTSYLSRIAHNCLKKSLARFEKSGKVRFLYSNIKFNPELELKYKRFIKYFDDLENIADIKNSDIIIDEISLYFDSHNWESLPRRTKKYLRLHRHYNVNIFGATQDFKTVDPSFRRLVAKDNLYYFDRFWASREPDPDLPPMKYPYLFTVRRRVRFDCYDDEKIDYRFTGYKFCLFLRKDFNVFDTHQEFSLGAIMETTKGFKDLRKVIQVCPEDGFTRVSYKESVYPT